MCYRRVCGSTPGDWGSNNPVFALSLRRCRTTAYTSSAAPRFTNMLLSPRPFGSRSVVRLGVIDPELRPPLVVIPSVRDTAHSFPACRSSLSNARGRARLCSVQRLAMDLPMAGGMQEHPVVCRITASVGPPDDVMVVPARQSGNLLMADRAKTLLVFPEVQQLPSAFQVVCHLHAYACFEVHFPVGIVRVCRPFDLHMPLDRHVSCTTERKFLRLPVVTHACPHEG